MPTPVVERVKVRLAPDLFDCGAEPEAPEDAPNVTELDFGRWVAELQAWGRGCQGRLLDAGKANAAP